MEYYRELLDRLVDGKFKPLIVGRDIKKYYGPIIDMAEDFEKEFITQLDDKGLEKFTLYKKLLQALTNGIVIEGMYHICFSLDNKHQNP